MKGNNQGFGSRFLTGAFVAQDSGSPASARRRNRPSGQRASAGRSDASGPESACEPARLGSPYIPVDSWVYPAMLRLYSLGYVDAAYLGLRPWTRASLMHMLEETGDSIEDDEANGEPGAAEARHIYDALNRELHLDMEGPCGPHQGGTRIESVYSVARGISGHST